MKSPNEIDVLYLFTIVGMFCVVSVIIRALWWIVVHVRFAP